MVVTGRLFQIRGAAAEKALPQAAESLTVNLASPGGHCKRNGSSARRPGTSVTSTSVQYRIELCTSTLPLVGLYSMRSET